MPSVVRARIFSWGGPVPSHIGTARGSFQERRGLLIALEDEAGNLGLGEAAPIPSLSAESLAEARQDLERFLMNSIPIPRVVTDLEGTLGVRSLSGQQGLAFALGTLAAQQNASSLAQWIAGSAALTSLPTSVYVGPTGDPETFSRIEAALARGATTLKLKRSLEPIERTLATCSQARALAGRIGLRLDCNGNGSAELVSRLAAVGLELIEEPVASASLLELEPQSTAVFADESLADPDLRSRLLDHPAIAGVVLKPMLLGVTQSIRLVEAASRRGKKAILTHAFEGPVGLAATCELALAMAARFPETMLAPGLDYHAAIEAFDCVNVPQVPKGAVRVTPSSLPGLGVQIDLSKHAEIFRWTR